MPAQVVIHEALDEPVAVVVAGVHAQFERLARPPAGVGEDLGIQLLGEESVRRALVHEDRRVERAPGHERARVVLEPLRLV